MTRTHVKAMVAKVMTVGLLAGAFAMAAPAKAQAQGFSVGVRFGQPVYQGYDDRRGYWEHERFERERREAYARQVAFERQQEFLRHEAWERQQRFYGHDRDFRGDRDDHFRGGDRDDYRR